MYICEQASNISHYNPRLEHELSSLPLRESPPQCKSSAQRFVRGEDFPTVTRGKEGDSLALLTDGEIIEQLRDLLDDGRLCAVVRIESEKYFPPRWLQIPSIPFGKKRRGLALAVPVDLVMDWNEVLQRYGLEALTAAMPPKRLAPEDETGKIDATEPEDPFAEN